MTSAPDGTVPSSRILSHPSGTPPAPVIRLPRGPPARRERRVARRVVPADGSIRRVLTARGLARNRSLPGPVQVQAMCGACHHVFVHSPKWRSALAVPADYVGDLAHIGRRRRRAAVERGREVSAKQATCLPSSAPITRRRRSRSGHHVVVSRLPSKCRRCPAPGWSGRAA